METTPLLIQIVRRLMNQVNEEREEKARYMKWAFSMHRLLGDVSPPLDKFKPQIVTEEEVLQRIQELADDSKPILHR
jgi:hypothetical protein